MGFSYQGSQNARFGIVAGKEREEEYLPSDDDDQTFTKRAEMVLKWGICYKNVRSSRKKKSWSQKTLFPNHWNGNLFKHLKGE